MRQGQRQAENYKGRLASEKLLPTLLDLQTPRLQTPLPALTGATPAKGRVETASPGRWRNRSCTHFSLPRLPHGGLIYTGDGAGEQGSVHLLGVLSSGSALKMFVSGHKLIPTPLSKKMGRSICV